MRYKILAGVFVGAIAVSGACVNVTVEDDDDSSNGSNTGASGVSTTKKASDFTPAEQQTFCQWLIDLVEPKVGDTVDCGGGLTITIEPFSEAQCEAQLNENAGCEVSKLEPCFELIVNDPCVLASETQPAVCQGLEQCADDTGTTNSTTVNSTTVNNEPNANPNSTTTEFCYNHDCNGDATGEKCFETEAAYCESLCAETNCVSTIACENECL